MRLTVAEIARRTDEHPRTVQRWLARVLGPGEERSRRVVTEADLERLAEALRVDRGALAESWGLGTQGEAA